MYDQVEILLESRPVSSQHHSGSVILITTPVLAHERLSIVGVGTMGISFIRITAERS